MAGNTHDNDSAYAYRPGQPYRPPVKKRRRRKRRGGAGIVVALFVPIVMILAAACFLLWQRLPNPRRDLIGEWRTQTDLSGQAMVRAQAWLEEAALGGSVRAEKHLPDGAPVRAETALTLSEDGSYALALDPESYQRAQQNAVSAFAAALVDLIGVRIRAAGRDEAYAAPEVVRSTFQAATGITPEEYLTLRGPALLPSLSEAQRFDRSGRFAIDTDGGRIVWDDGAEDPYVLNGDLLLLSGGLPVLGGETAAESVLFRRGEQAAVSLHALRGDLSRRAANGLTRTFPAFPSLALTAHAKNFRIVENLPVETGSGRKTVKAIHADYQNNRYLSLRDLAGALAGSAREFALTVTASGAAIDTAGTYAPVGGENEPFALADGDTYTAGELKTNDLTIDGRSVKYYTYLGKNTAGKADLFLNLTDFCLIFDINAEIDGGALKIDTSTRELAIDMGALRAAGFYDEMRAAVVGDATSGEIYESYRADLAIPIASTTKLMSYAVIMDAVTAGEISMDDTVTISAGTAALSQGQDRVIPMREGQESNVRELLQGMLIASSNESALALAEHVAGSEDAFVDRMKRKAVELGLSEATAFYNCNGLPVFADAIATAKMQNHMSAKDMFALSSYLLSVYPQITEITSTQKAALPTLQMDIKTTNALLYNLPGVTGLKTGTTNMAGACVVVSYHLESAGGPHDLVAVVLGAEDNTVRFTSAEVLLRYAKQCLLSGGETQQKTLSADELPQDAEGIIRLVLSHNA